MKNYLFDLYPSFPNEFNLENRKDPDSCSKDLYDDLKINFFNDEANAKLGIKNVKNVEQNYGSKYYTLFVDNDEFLLSVDYIGPSIYWAEKAGLSEKEVISYLGISRTLGGHIVWPRGENENISYRFSTKNYPITVNIARGGQNGYYDRIDLTLYALKLYYNGDESAISNNCMKQAIENYSNWFNLFKGENPFKFFIDFFKLQDFVNENYDVYDLTTFDDSTKNYDLLINETMCIPSKKEEYLNFIHGTNYAISLRNERFKL